MTTWVGVFIKKNVGKSLIVAGIITAILGIIFTLQGKSVVGPSSSFMYSNPSWTVIGSVVIAISSAIILTGIILWRSSLE